MEARIALAFVAKRQGASIAPEATWANVMSLELGWFSPAQARQYIIAAKAHGLLEGDDELRLTYDAKEVEIPRGFRPTGEIEMPEADARAPDPFLDLVDRLAASKGTKRQDVLAAVGDMQERFGGKLHAEAALIRLAAEAGLDVVAEAEAALDNLTMH